MANVFELIGSSAVGSGGASSIDFTSISSSYNNLLILISVRRTSSTGTGQLAMQINGDTGSNYIYKLIEGTGTGVGAGSSSSSTQLRIGQAEPSNFTSDTFSSTSVLIPNYKGSNFKSVNTDSSSENNASESYNMFTANRWSSTSSITSISIFPAAGGNFAQYSTAYLYGISNS
jgi:hypothetical protein